MENNFQYAQEDSTSTTNENVNNEQTGQQSVDGTPSTEQSIADLSKYERFKYGDKEYSRDDLMRQSDYTKKTQEIAQIKEEQKFFTNLQADLDAVARNPALASQFKNRYPEKFHGYLNFVSRETQTSNSSSNQRTQNEMDPRLERALSAADKVEMIEKKLQQREVESATVEIDSIMTKMSAKYPNAIPKVDGEANEDYVINRAQQALAAKGPNARLSDLEWENIFKKADAFFKKFSDNNQKTMNSNQKAANVRGKDIGGGGGVPGGAPRMPRTIREASKIAEEDLGSRYR